jgi:hypothetical protein
MHAGGPTALTPIDITKHKNDERCSDLLFLPSECAPANVALREPVPAPAS